MKGDIALAGFLWTSDDWEALDPPFRAALISLAKRCEDGWVVGGLTGVLSEPFVKIPVEQAA